MQPVLEGGAARLGRSSNGSQQESSHLDTWVGGGGVLQPLSAHFN